MTYFSIVLGQIIMFIIYAAIGILTVIGIFLNVKLPAPLGTALTKTGAISTPLAMIYLGGIFCYTGYCRDHERAFGSSDYDLDCHAGSDSEICG